MNHTDYVNLLRPANLPSGGVSQRDAAQWADLGAGAGAFTLALRELVGPEARLYAVDRDGSSLRELERQYRRRFGSSQNLTTLEKDFSQALTLPPLDGVLMANSLHFFKDKDRLLRHVGAFLKPGGTLLLVEYNVDRGNLWVPYPLSFETFQALAPRAGFGEPRLLATHPSSFLREFYAATATK